MIIDKYSLNSKGFHFLMLTNSSNMLKFGAEEFLILKRVKTFYNNTSYSLQASSKNTKAKNIFQHTVFLPKTSFPIYFNPKEVVERDQKIFNEAEFLGLYKWQRDNLKGKEYVLHDGPPYANGKPHIGHAINKILKDIILRSQIVQGNRVHFVPGWDCHGLPIEMVALKGSNHILSPMKIREKAKDVSILMSKIQMEAFKHWGVCGDWNSQCYYTFDADYVINQLQVFWKLFEKRLIYYDLKPVYWSPSSQTALAEAELVYKNHTSKSVTVRFELIQDSSSEPLYLLVWTTTPWTLPLNKAVYCGANLKYSIVKISSFPGLYIIATKLIKPLKDKLKKEILEQSTISCADLKQFKYRHPWDKNKCMQVYVYHNLKETGTGFLHSVPGHGHEDYVMGLSNNLKVKSYVDEKGCYTSDVGPDLAGMDVLETGSGYVINKLLSDIILEEDYSHNYPYDWRTDKPVIISASKQWFIDCDQLKDDAIESLQDVNVPIEYFQLKLKNRQYWCLSRQRTWGVPIPVFYHRKSGRPLLSKSLIYHLCQLIESSGPDIWWTEKLDILFPKKVCEELFVKIEDVVKGKDIMDIWFDSGTSWSYVLNGKKSDLFLEGPDQYRGWFQSSLLSGVALKGSSPFKKIMTHGFAVDKDGRKMSKSLGNVVDPESIVKGDNAFGVDTLRWWVGFHSHQVHVPVSNEILISNFESLKKIKLIFRFLLGALNGFSKENLEVYDQLNILDRYMLNSCYKFFHSVMNSYNSQDIGKVFPKLLFFVSNEISARYVNAIKDRLYCDQIDSPRRRACQYTIDGILQTLCQVVAPILPHLIEEVYSYHPIYGGQQKFFYNKHMWAPPSSWRDDSADQSINLTDEIKNNFLDFKTLSKMSCLIQIEKEHFELLKKLQHGKEKDVDSELTEILLVAEVQLKIGERKVTLTPTTSSQCLRCRRYTARENNQLCERCERVVSLLERLDN